MSRLPRVRDTETLQLPKHCLDLSVAPAKRSGVTPHCDYDVSFGAQCRQPAVIVGTDRRWVRHHCRGVGGSEGKEVGDAHATVTPRFNEPAASAYGGVIGNLISRGWVKADEQHGWLGFVPNAPKRIAIRTTFRKGSESSSG